MYGRHPIEIIGSDGRKYLIETDRGREPYSVVLSIIPVQVEVDYHSFKEAKVDMFKEAVERYIDSIKDQYEPSKQQIYETIRILSGTTIANHFDYLALLKTVLPKLEKLLQ